MKEILKGADDRNARALAASDPNRLQYHLMPPVGWLNDPNGLCQIGDTYHIFYQYTPLSADGNGPRGWGHYATKDFVHYTEEEDTLAPDSEMDFGGSYSGSAFQKDGTTHFFYTGNGKLEGDYDYINSGRIHWTNHFSTADGKTFTPKETLMKNEDYPANLSCHVRDPKIIEDNGTFYMVLGARTKDSRGQANLFQSDDLKTWKPVSVISSKEPFGFMWECPDLFDVDGKRILITCPQGVDTQGYLYENVYQNGYFVVEGALDKDIQVDNFQEFDNGFDFYAPQSFEDQQGRRILIGWIGLPDADYENPTMDFHWQHALTMPRELHYHDGRLFQYPIAEMEQLRNEEVQTVLEPGKPLVLNGIAQEIHLDTHNKPFTLQLRKDVELSWKDGLFTLKMGESGHGRKERHVEIADLHSLEIFSDTSVLEIFLNHGQRAFTSRVYDGQSDLQLCSSTKMDLQAWDLKSFDVQYRM